MICSASATSLLPHARTLDGNTTSGHILPVISSLRPHAWPFIWVLTWWLCSESQHDGFPVYNDMRVGMQGSHVGDASGSRAIRAVSIGGLCGNGHAAGQASH